MFNFVSDKGEQKIYFLGFFHASDMETNNKCLYWKSIHRFKDVRTNMGKKEWKQKDEEEITKYSPENPKSANT